MSLEGNSYEDEHDVPDPVLQAVALAERMGFPMSCVPGTGRLLRTLAAAAGPGARIGEIGTGTGVGTAWLADGMAEGATLTTIEVDADQAKAVEELFVDDPAVTVRDGDWRLLAGYGPFDLLFVDGGDGKTMQQDHVIAMVRPGGVIVSDDFSPSWDWPPTHEGGTDATRLFWLTDPRLVSTQVQVSEHMLCLVSVVRRVN